MLFRKNWRRNLIVLVAIALAIVVLFAQNDAKASAPIFTCQKTPISRYDRTIGLAAIHCDHVPGFRKIRIWGELKSKYPAGVHLLLQCMDGFRSKIIPVDGIFEIKLDRQTTPATYRMMSKSVCDLTVELFIHPKTPPLQVTGFHFSAVAS